MFNRGLIWGTYIILLLAQVLSFSWSQELSEQAPFSIGEATASGVSIAQRLSNYYGAIGAGILLLISFQWIFNKVKISLENNPFLSWVDHLLLLGIVLQFCSFFGIKTMESTYIIGGFSLVLVLLGQRTQLAVVFRHPETWLQLLLVFCVNYLLFHSAIIGFGITLLLFFLLHRSPRNRITFWVTILAITTPITAFLTIESTLIFNQRGLYLSNYWVAAGISTVLIGAYFWRKQAQFQSGSATFTYRYLVPIAIIGITLVQTYSPILVQPTEVFEYANKLNPVMQAVNFGEFPLLDNLSSHLASDFFWEFAYRFANGYHQDASLLIYSEFTWILLALSIYYFVKEISGEHPLIVLVFVFFPFLFFVIPPYYAVVLIPVVRFLRFQKNANRKNLYFFFLSVAFVTLWRLDLGVSLIFTLLLFLPFWWYWAKSERRLLVKTLLYFGIVAVVLSGIFILQFPSAFEQLKGYFGANQAHGLSLVTYTEHKWYFSDYIALPALIAGMTVIAVFRLKNSDQRLHYLVQLLLAGFYFFNLQRGLVRHSFVENNEIQITSFAWLLLLLEMGFQLRNKRNVFTYSLIGSTLIGIFFSISMSFEGNSTLLERNIRLSLKDLPDLSKGKVNRVITNEAFSQQYAPVIDFLQQELSPKETFLDFSNNPLLYFYTGKNIPSYFNQYLQNTVSERLQEINSEQFPLPTTPIVVFARTPETFFDHTDNIPNKVRYFRILQTVYRHYTPWKEVNGFRIWKRKNVLHPKDSSYTTIPENWNLGLLPYYWKPGLKKERFRLVKQAQVWLNTSKNELLVNGQLDPLSFLELNIASSVEKECSLENNAFKVSFRLKKGKHRYRIPIGCSEQLHDRTDLHFQLTHLQAGSIQSAYIVRLNR